MDQQNEQAVEATEAPAQPMGIENLKEVLDLGLTLVEIGKSASADGKIGLDDLPLLLKLPKVVSPALADMDKIPAELKDLSVEEAAELTAHVVSKLAIDNEKAKVIAEKALKAGFAVYDLIRAV